MRQSEREHVLAEIADLRTVLESLQGRADENARLLATATEQMAQLLTELQPWVTLAEVCDMQRVSIETAAQDLYYLPNFGAVDGPQGWRRETVRAWIGVQDEHRRRWTLFRGEVKERYRARFAASIGVPV